jgi:hypothetical protein
MVPPTATGQANGPRGSTRVSASRVAKLKILASKTSSCSRS